MKKTLIILLLVFLLYAGNLFCLGVSSNLKEISSALFLNQFNAFLNTFNNSKNDEYKKTYAKLRVFHAIFSHVDEFKQAINISDNVHSNFETFIDNYFGRFYNLDKNNEYKQGIDTEKKKEYKEDLIKLKEMKWTLYYHVGISFKEELEAFFESLKFDDKGEACLKMFESHFNEIIKDIFYNNNFILTNEDVKILGAKKIEIIQDEKNPKIYSLAVKEKDKLKPINFNSEKELKEHIETIGDKEIKELLLKKHEELKEERIKFFSNEFVKATCCMDGHFALFHDIHQAFFTPVDLNKTKQWNIADIVSKYREEKTKLLAELYKDKKFDSVKTYKVYYEFMKKYLGKIPVRLFLKHALLRLKPDTDPKIMDIEKLSEQEVSSLITLFNFLDKEVGIGDIETFFDREEDYIERGTITKKELLTIINDDNDKKVSKILDNLMEEKVLLKINKPDTYWFQKDITGEEEFDFLKNNELKTMLQTKSYGLPLDKWKTDFCANTEYLQIFFNNKDQLKELGITDEGVKGLSMLSLLLAIPVPKDLFKKYNSISKFMEEQTAFLELEKKNKISLEEKKILRTILILKFIDLNESIWNSNKFYEFFSYSSGDFDQVYFFEQVITQVNANTWRNENFLNFIVELKGDSIFTDKELLKQIIERTNAETWLSQDFLKFIEKFKESGMFNDKDILKQIIERTNAETWLSQNFLKFIEKFKGSDMFNDKDILKQIIEKIDGTNWYDKNFLKFMENFNKSRIFTDTKLLKQIIEKTNNYSLNFLKFIEKFKESGMFNDKDILKQIIERTNAETWLSQNFLKFIEKFKGSDMFNDKDILKQIIERTNVKTWLSQDFLKFIEKFKGSDMFNDKDILKQIIEKIDGTNWYDKNFLKFMKNFNKSRIFTDTKLLKQIIEKTNNYSLNFLKFIEKFKESGMFNDKDILQQIIEKTTPFAWSSINFLEFIVKFKKSKMFTDKEILKQIIKKTDPFAWRNRDFLEFIVKFKKSKMFTDKEILKQIIKKIDINNWYNQNFFKFIQNFTKTKDNYLLTKIKEIKNINFNDKKILQQIIEKTDGFTWRDRDFVKFIAKFKKSKMFTDKEILQQIIERTDKYTWYIFWGSSNFLKFIVKFKEINDEEILDRIKQKMNNDNIFTRVKKYLRSSRIKRLLGSFNLATGITRFENNIVYVKNPYDKNKEISITYTIEKTNLSFKELVSITKTKIISDNELNKTVLAELAVLEWANKNKYADNSWTRELGYQKSIKDNWKNLSKETQNILIKDLKTAVKNDPVIETIDAIFDNISTERENIVINKLFEDVKTLLDSNKDEKLSLSINGKEISTQEIKEILDKIKNNEILNENEKNGIREVFKLFSKIGLQTAINSIPQKLDFGINDLDTKKLSEIDVLANIGRTIRSAA